MITTNFEQFFYSKGITKPYAWMKKQRIPNSTTNRLLRGQMKSLPFKLLEKLCVNGWCTPNDLLQWQPDDPKKDLAANHPLQAMKPRVLPNVQSKLKTLNADQVLAVDAFIEKLREGESGGSGELT